MVMIMLLRMLMMMLMMMIARCTWKGEANRPDCEEADTFHQDFLCPESGFGEYLRYPDPADCRAYYVCVQGAASRSICPAGQVFCQTSSSPPTS